MADALSILIGLSIFLVFILIVLLIITAFKVPSQAVSESKRVRSDIKKIKKQIDRDDEDEE